jgi:DNA-binding MarR family transcriptional regulator
MSESIPSTDPQATRLALALKHMRARVREKSTAGEIGLTTTQLSIFSRLRLHGPTTASSLAAAEHISQQAIAQSVMPLKAAGLVRSDPDPSDRRKTLLSITEAGLAARKSVVAAGNSWLEGAIESTLDAEQRRTLDQAIELLETLADADL